MKRMLAVLTLAALAAACSPSDGDTTQDGIEAPSGLLPAGPETEAAPVAIADLPPAVAALVQQTIPGMTITEVERKAREGRVYYDVEGARPGGEAVELDIQQTGDRFEVVEIQRDIAFADMPAPVQAAARAATGAFAPARIIESRQTDDSVIYELFAPGQPAEPAMEVRLKDGKAEVLTERWPH